MPKQILPQKSHQMSQFRGGVGFSDLKLFMEKFIFEDLPPSPPTRFGISHGNLAMFLKDTVLFPSYRGQFFYECLLTFITGQAVYHRRLPFSVQTRRAFIPISSVATGTLDCHPCIGREASIDWL